MLRSSNPALGNNSFTAVEPTTGLGVMSVNGTVNKSLALVGLIFVAAYWSFSRPEVIFPFLIPAVLGSLVIAFVTIFKKSISPITAPIYALGEGVVLGCISAIFEQKFQGIAFQALSLTFGTLMAMLLAYKSGVIKATEKFKLGVIAATGGIALVYLINMIIGFFGKSIAVLHSSSPLGIGISLVIVVVAALNLVIDFDFIERNAANNVPKYMEWYSAFALIITLVWLYMEMLRLLAKVRQR